MSNGDCSCRSAVIGSVSIHGELQIWVKIKFIRLFTMPLREFKFKWARIAIGVICSLVYICVTINRKRLAKGKFTLCPALRERITLAVVLLFERICYFGKCAVYYCDVYICWSCWNNIWKQTFGSKSVVAACFERIKIIDYQIIDSFIYFSLF